MPSVSGTKYLTGSGSNKFGSYSVEYWVHYTDSYDPETNTSSVTLDRVVINVNKNFGGSPVYGTVWFGANQKVKTFSGGWTNRAAGGYKNEITNSDGGTATFVHNDDGTRSFTLRLYDVGPSYDGADFDASPSGDIVLTTYTQKLTVNPNGGIWNGSSESQFFDQAPTSATPIPDPTMDGAVFLGWTLTGGGTLEDGEYTFGTADGVLKANWSYTITCEDRVGDQNGALLGTGTMSATYGESISGASFGADTTVSAYYPHYCYTSGTSAVVTGVQTVYRFFSLKTYSLTYTESETGIISEAYRTSSPSGLKGYVYNGNTLYHGDVIRVAWSLASGYTEDVLEINGVDVSDLSPAEKTITVESDVVIIMTAKVAALVKLWDGSNWVDYQAFVWDGSNWVQYKPVIWDGSNWIDY